MEKDSLPKLEIDGFSTRPDGASRQNMSKREPIMWMNKTVSIARKFSAPVKRLWAGDDVQSAAQAERPSDIDASYKRLLIKTGICAVIAITILIISSINTPVTNSITEAIDDTINHEFDIDEDIGKLKFVRSLDEETASVFSALPAAAVVYPVGGEIITAFGDSGSYGVRISSGGDEVANIAKGTVTAAGEVDGLGYVKVELDAGETVVYYNIEPCVQVDDIVYAGQAIGDVAGNYLYLEMKSGDEYIDPIHYIDQRAALVVQ